MTLPNCPCRFPPNTAFMSAFPVKGFSFLGLTRTKSVISQQSFLSAGGERALHAMSTADSPRLTPSLPPNALGVEGTANENGSVHNRPPFSRIRRRRRVVRSTTIVVESSDSDERGGNDVEDGYDDDVDDIDNNAVGSPPLSSRMPVSGAIAEEPNGGRAEVTNELGRQLSDNASRRIANSGFPSVARNDSNGDEDGGRGDQDVYSRNAFDLVDNNGELEEVLRLSANLPGSRSRSPPHGISSIKRLRSLSPAPMPPEAAASQGDEPQNCCAICMEPWDKAGDHRLVCLPCGHLLGLSCARQWLSQKKLCPMCKTKAVFKNCRIVFGAPTKLRVLEHEEFDQVREQLANEREAHRRTRDKYEALKNKSRTYKTQLAAMALAERNRAVMLDPASHTTTAIGGTSRAGTRSVPTAFAGTGAPGRVLGGASTGGVASVTRNQLATTTNTIDAHSSQHPKTLFGPLSTMFRVKTTGDSGVFVFDKGSVVLSESTIGGVTGSRLTRVPLTNPAVTTSSTTIGRLINDVSINEGATDVHTGMMAVACDKSLRILSRHFQDNTTYTLQANAQSCSWVAGMPYLVVVGLQNGTVCAFDIRLTSRTPLYEVRVGMNGAGPAAVHSLAQLNKLPSVPQGSLLAASPRRVGVLSFGTGVAGTMHFEALHGIDNVCAGATAFGKYVMVSSRNGTAGSHSVHDGIARMHVPSAGVDIFQENDEEERQVLKLCEVVGGSPLTGHKQALRPFVRAAGVMSPSGEAMIVSGDDEHSGQGGARVWFGGRTGRRGSGFTGAHGDFDAGGPVRCVQAVVYPERESNRMPPLVGTLSAGQLSVFRSSVGGGGDWDASG
jgi:Ring finger domain